MSRPARALLDARALVHNLQRVREHAPAAKVMAIIKANAYGHGLVWAARHLSAADAFGVACAEEGMELRAAGIKQPICLLEGFFERAEIPLLQQHALAPVLHHEAQLRDLETASGPPIDVWLKLNTGMHRIGFPPVAVHEVLNRLKAIKALGTLRALSHFANADNKFDTATGTQTELFLQLLGKAGMELSLANSAGVVAWPASHLQWVRPGIMLYGVSPVIGMSAKALDLHPVMTLTSALISVQRVPRGAAVGYGGDFVAPEPMSVGVVAMGYGDGYPRHMAPGAPVLVNGIRVPLIGRVSMDMITVDLRAQPNAKVGDPVVLWGRGLPVEEVATHAGTIGYTLLCGVTPRIPRVEWTNS
jgi:alanine racemase